MVKAIMILLLAPAAVIVTPRTTTSVFVAINATDGNTDINFYEASYQREFCTVQATTSPLRCAHENLSAGTRYRISGMACDIYSHVNL